MPDWTSAAYVIAGAVIGGPLRFFITEFVAERSTSGFPWGTLAVNVSGALAIGAFAAYAEAHGFTSKSSAWLFFATGVLGSYTTVSSFAFQSITLAHDGKRRSMFRYVALSVLLCLGAVVLGFGVVEALVR